MKSLKIFRNFTEKNYYELLGVRQSSNKNEIKAAYLSLAKKYHPDSKEGDEERFKLISKAYQVLKNETEREEYNTQIRKVDRKKKQKENESEKRNSYTQQAFNKKYEEKIVGNKWSGGGFTEAKKGEMKDSSIKPGDVFLNMGLYAVGASALVMVGYILVLMATPVPVREKVERPEGISTKMPERRPRVE